LTTEFEVFVLHDLLSLPELPHRRTLTESSRPVGVSPRPTDAVRGLHQRGGGRQMRCVPHPIP
jgi:hypothetical protein